MFEKHIVLEDVEPVVFYGVNNIHMQMIQALYPKLRIVARGDVIITVNNSDDPAHFEVPAEGNYVGALSGKKVASDWGKLRIDLDGNGGEIWLPEERSEESGRWQIKC